MKIGIFSGTFNPIHCGHAMLANYLAQYAGLDRLWLMPSPLNPLKSDSHPVEFAHRYEMCRIVARKCRNVDVSDFESGLPVPSYTYNTLRELKRTFPDDDFRLVIGSDNWNSFEQWRNPEEIIREFGLIVYMRPGAEILGNVPENVRVIYNAPMALISSTLIREILAEGGNLSYLLDADVIDYIRKNKLYV